VGSGSGPYLALGVGLDLPAPGQLQLGVREPVQEHHQVPVVLVALKVPGVAPHLQDHVLHTAAAGEHPVGGLDRGQRSKVRGQRSEDRVSEDRGACVCV